MEGDLNNAVEFTLWHNFGGGNVRNNRLIMRFSEFKLAGAGGTATKEVAAWRFFYAVLGWRAKKK